MGVALSQVFGLKHPLVSGLPRHGCVVAEGLMQGMREAVNVAENHGRKNLIDVLILH